LLCGSGPAFSSVGILNMLAGNVVGHADCESLIENPENQRLLKGTGCRRG